MSAGCGCQYDAAGRVFVDRCACSAVLRDHAAAEAARRDDLARDVARAYAAQRNAVGFDASLVASKALWGALDRLTAAYLPDGPKDTPR